jgi:pimeloyl-ACP methyl ester carboxylesterase
VRAIEVQALGDLAGEAVSGTAARIEEMHTEVAGRAFGAVGAAGQAFPPVAWATLPVQAIHGSVARNVYKGVQYGLSAAMRAGSEALSRTVPASAVPIERALAGRVALGALNGAFGDLLERRRNALTIGMSIRKRGRVVGTSPPQLVAAFPDATPKLAVFVHGLCGTEDGWWLGSGRHTPYGARLRSELAYTPVYVRYNSGRHISENGHELALLLDQVVEGWPVAVAEIALIGHSMGGLVARSACHYGAGSAWPSRVRHVFTLGSPHRGAPLEQLACAASDRLGALPETRAMQSTLNLRSAGIKDLCHGFLCDEDWIGCDSKSFLRETARQIPFLRGANHYFVSATVTRDPDSPAGRLVGDLLVLHASAWGRERDERLTFPIDHYWHIGPAHHMGLLNHPAVYEQLRKWLSGKPSATVAVMAQD